MAYLEDDLGTAGATQRRADVDERIYTYLLVGPDRRQRYPGPPRDAPWNALVRSDVARSSTTTTSRLSAYSEEAYAWRTCSAFSLRTVLVRGLNQLSQETKRAHAPSDTVVGSE